ncbi:MAG: biotin synthase BioB [Flavobacteriales bacterium]
MPAPIRYDWTLKQVLEIYNRPLINLLYEAATVHREHHNPREVQVSTLLSVKTGGCPEDCGYCPQAARYHTNVENTGMMKVSEVVDAAKNAKASGSSRLCLGAAWRNVKDDDDFDQVLEMVRSINELEMEVCCTLGMLTENQAKRLRDAGLYAYNHNLDSSDEFYKEIISTRTFDDRLTTLDNARKANLTLCSGGIIGMGESVEDRANMLITLANLKPHPESTPINALVPVEGTPLEEQKTASIWEMVRTIATARIVLPTTTVRLSAGRTEMSAEGQALCFLAGASSIFAGDKLLTTPNPDVNSDMELFNLLGLVPTEPYAKGDKPTINEAYKNRPENTEKPKWSRPGHTIEANEKAKEKAKELRENGFEPRKITTL